MKLSELVALQNQLDALSVEHARGLAAAELNKYVYAAQLGVSEPLSQQLQQRYQEIQISFDIFRQAVDNIQAELKQQIAEQGQYWFQESYRLYDQEMSKFETTEYILNRRLELPSEATELLRARLRLYADWKYPGMILRPGLETFVQELVSYDPLYLVDQSHDLLLPTLGRFNELYQNRLRTYAIKESTTQPILDKIPNNQFGVVFAYNFFDFKPLDLLKQYLQEIYQKLRPGGVLIMTFNDCDRRRAVEAVENHYACYTPGQLVVSVAQAIGYTVNWQWQHDNEASACLELKKAGELTSLRGGQTLAKMQFKSVDNDQNSL